MDAPLWIAAAALAAVVGFLLLRVLWAGAIASFAYAMAFGTGGVVIYFLLWFFLAPFMLVYCFIVGLFARDIVKTIEKTETARRL